MEHSNNTPAKIPILNTGKFKQWKFRIQQYLQHEYYALWEVIEFRDSYVVPTNNTATVSASEGTATKKGRTTSQELWAAIRKTFGGNEATKKTKKNLLKQHYGNFKAKVKETLEHTFNRLQAIVSQLEFMDVEIEQDDLNQKLLTSLSPEWLMHTIVWRNRSDLDTMSLDDLYNHLKVYEYEVKKKSESNSQNMAFISSAKHSSGNKEVNTASVSTASTNVSPASANIGAASISQDTACAYITSQSYGSQIKFEDINQINEDDMEEMDIKWNMALLSMRADRGCRAPRSQDKGRRDNYRQGSKVEEQNPKVLMAINGVGWDWSFMANEQEDHALVTDEDAPTEFALMAKTSADSEEGLESKLTGFQSASKDLDSLLESQRLDKNKEGLGYSSIPPPPPTQVYSPPKKDLSWTGILEFADDTVTDYSRPSPAIKGTSDDAQNKNPSAPEIEASPSTISSKPFIKFVKAADPPTVAKLDKKETVRKPSIKYAKVYRKPTKRKFPTGNTKFSTVDLGNKGKAVKASACWIWKPTQNLTNKGIKREFSNARTPQQNVVAERRNRTLIEAARTMLADAKLPVTFWAEAINTACYVLDNLGKFEAKGDEGYFLGYSMSSKAFRVFNKRTKRAEENLHVDFLENKPIEKGTKSTNFSGTKEAAGQDVKKDVSSLRYIVLPTCGNFNPTATSINPPADHMESLAVETPIPTVSSPVSTACLNDSPKPSNDTRIISKRVTSQDDAPSLDNILSLTNRFEEILGFTTNTDDSNGVEADLGNMETTITASPTSTNKIHKDHLKRVRPIGTKWVLKNKKDERGIVIKNKSSLPDGCEECLPYVTIDEEVYVMQPPRFQDPEFPARVYKVEKAIGNSNPTATSTNPLDDQLETLIVETPIPTASSPVPTVSFTDSQEPLSETRLISKRVTNLAETPSLDNILTLTNQFEDILKDTSNSEESNGVEADADLALLQFCLFSCFLSQVEPKKISDAIQDPSWGKDGTGKDVDLHVYRSMIGSLMYLTASRPDIMFAVYAYARHQVTPKECHLHVVKRIFRYLKGHPKLGLWYPKDSPFDLMAYSDSDCGGASQDRKSTFGGCQFWGRRIISWQCKKQTIVATSTTEAEYVAAASCCGQVLWIQNQLLDCG
nr:hypothetical protein [Tanacetum cinerariifolium]